MGRRVTCLVFATLALVSLLSGCLRTERKPDNNATEEQSEETSGNESTGEARTIVLRENATFGSREELDLYIDEKKALLEEVSASAPDRLAPASVSFKRPIEVTELGRIIEEYCFEWEYLEYEGDKIRGGYSRRILEELSGLGELVRRDVGEDVAVVGVTYINGGATLKDLNRLLTHPDVILVDLGPFKKAEDLRSQGYDVVMVPGRNLYQLYNEYR